MLEKLESLKNIQRIYISRMHSFTNRLSQDEHDKLKLLNIEIRELERKIMTETLRKRFDTEIPESEIYPKVHVDQESFITNEELKCSFCGCESPAHSFLCQTCGKEFPKCNLCKRKISSENLSHCPFCNMPFHKDEFLEWLKNEAKCPNCKKEIDMLEFQKILHSVEVKKANDSKFCPNCNKQTPLDSQFCIFCGFKL